jgi:hypothetical protein
MDVSGSRKIDLGYEGIARALTALRGSLLSAALHR